MNFPPQFVAGDTVKWQDDAQYGDLDTSIESEQYTVTYSIRGASSKDVVGTLDGTGWLFALAPTDTEGWTPGIYYWQATATNTAGDSITLGQGTTQVLINIAAQAGTFDGRTQYEQDLAAVEAEIRARINNGASLEYSIGNRSLKREPLSELRNMRAELRRLVVRERQMQDIAAGRGNPRQVFVSFGSPFVPRP